MRKEETSTYVAMPDGFGVRASTSRMPRPTAISGTPGTRRTATNTGVGAAESNTCCAGTGLWLFGESPGQQFI